MSLTLDPLPYSEKALEPYISAETLGFHYHKHHAGYLDRLNGMLKGTELEQSTLEEVITASTSGSIFNNAAQIWNHTFYWNSMSPGGRSAGGKSAGGGDPTGSIQKNIEASFGSADKFREEFFEKATGHFGSGWVWLTTTQDSDTQLEIITTQNADLPLPFPKKEPKGEKGRKALLTLDVWEHAYYLDYQNRRADYVKSWLEELLNWEFANSCLN